MEISFLLEDAHEIRRHLQQLWKRYLNLEIDLITATFVTVAATQNISSTHGQDGCDIDSISKDLRCMLSAYTEARRLPKIVADMEWLSSILKGMPDKGPIHTDLVFLCRVVLDLLGMEGLQQHVDADIQQYCCDRGEPSIGLPRAPRRASAGLFDSNLIYLTRLDSSTIPLISVLESRLSKNKPAACNPIFLGSVLLNIMERINVTYLSTINDTHRVLVGAHINAVHGYVSPWARDHPELKNERLREDRERIEATANRKTARSILREAEANGRYRSLADRERYHGLYVAKRNTPGWRRELYVPRFLPSVDQSYTHFQEEHPGRAESRSGGSSELWTPLLGKLDRSTDFDIWDLTGHSMQTVAEDIGRITAKDKIVKDRREFCGTVALKVPDELL
ncbi:hypothetical protein CMUS01_16308 [Colletotrichum musicola]|uniref:DUF6604 domain-containing protein n=1 Tax=Colletotrichum musicola TaxID=2175873 RepID=A0A8H6IQ07_9PEZI|nr:hypothetical protein CMUS01_16308 [Colletotrichum musicola]